MVIGGNQKNIQVNIKLYLGTYNINLDKLYTYLEQINIGITQEFNNSK